MAICKNLDITDKVEYLAVTSIDGVAAIWSGETVTYDIQVENTGNVAASGTLELYTHTLTNELVVLDTVAIPELAIATSTPFSLIANSVGLDEGTYSVCAKTDFEAYV